MQWAKTSRTNQLLAVFKVGKSVVLPGVHEVLHVLLDDRTDWTTFALKSATQHISVSGVLHHFIFFLHRAIPSGYFKK